MEKRLKITRFQISSSLRRIGIALAILGIILTVFTMESLAIKSSVPEENARTVNVAYAQIIPCVVVEKNPVFVGANTTIGYTRTAVAVASVNITVEGILAPNLLYNVTELNSTFYFTSITKELKIYVSPVSHFQYSVYLIDPGLFSKMLYTNISSSPFLVNYTYLQQYSAKLSQELGVPSPIISINFTIPIGNKILTPSIVLNPTGGILRPVVLNATLTRMEVVPIQGYRINQLSVPQQLIQLVDVKLFTYPSNWKEINYTVLLNGSSISLVATKGSITSPEDPVSLNLTALYQMFNSVQEEIGFQPSFPDVIVKYSMFNGNVTFSPYVVITQGQNGYLSETVENNTINRVVYYTVKKGDFNYVPFLAVMGVLASLALYLYFGTEVKKVDARLQAFRKFVRKYGKISVLVKDELQMPNYIQVRDPKELVKIAIISGAPILVDEIAMRVAVKFQDQWYVHIF
ncbi:hypothetical protein L3N51_02381 [Metallosphaera sp. J1]|uniref:DUF5305 domain-containing protein n=1 Tax=Metallosphaera javensis (ex Hofmann et al. 2022) TaxID=99938 RepID=UPI001EDEAE8E|nr:DUF5305 domain-containing protein [Metallosphaera javensis (ex Hofmann et al. 2022)]MCG3110084.1 hypothetical protein [Metallosphaera javensis (ex Hofmann et al. 2022)]